MDTLPHEVLTLLNSKALEEKLDVLVSKILHSFRVIGTDLRNGDFSHEHAGTQNAFGDHQLEIDLLTEESKNNIIFKWNISLYRFPLFSFND